MVLKKYKPKIVAVTGTVGKTSTKDAIYTALSKSLSIRKARKSQNSDIGLPLTILGTKNPTNSTSAREWLEVLIEGVKLILFPNHYPEWLVLELGADHPGDIESATKWVRPDVSVITKLSKVPVHVEFFASVEEVIKEKGYLAQALKSPGTLILNADDEDVVSFKDLTSEKVLYFGEASTADIVLENYAVSYDSRDLPDGIMFDVYYRAQDSRFPVMLKGTLGRHLVYPILAALAVTEATGENVLAAAKTFRTHEPTPGRMRIIEGERGSVIIDDTYNSSPVALEEALLTLNSLHKSKRKIAVLGDMLELGKFSIDEHKKAGVLAAECSDMLVTIGQRSKYAAEAARQSGLGEVREFDDSREAGIFLKGIIETGDAVLVKGSQGIRAERVVEMLMKHPEEKERLLVRQDQEWIQRDRKHK
ncbi:MAG: UDP-N-acetylmuramoylalanyl-D-glutamyl-2,6-diaminopimelate--D-alanyl-D-alanyl ligase [Parcubacteria group bacterium]|nr:UDP-N-acetylmuramoylalanyl-D-glutamyl-2,6-diaminopimelate--D-alanyl-D-alanyl ligase [Parcubacteria group bacterium]